MKNPVTRAVLLALAVVAPCFAAPETTAENPAVVAVVRKPDPGYGWEKRHAAVVAANAERRPDIVMMGDSIIHLWGGEPAYPHRNGAASWAALFKGRAVVNAGFGSDCTQHLLWRITHGELDAVSPGHVVLLIGTNNLTGQPHCSRATTPAETVAGVRACVVAARKKQPRAKILVVSLLPRSDNDDALLPAIRETNAGLAVMAKAEHVAYLDVYPKFLTPAGGTNRPLFLDGVHPNAAGYRIFADALAPAIATQ